MRNFEIFTADSVVVGGPVQNLHEQYDVWRENMKDITVHKIKYQPIYMQVINADPFSSWNVYHTLFVEYEM